MLCFVRLHEASSKLAQAGVEQCRDARERPIQDVLRQASELRHATEPSWGEADTVSYSRTDLRSYTHVVYAFGSLGLGVIQDFNALKPDSQTKNIAAWTPVVAEVLNGFARFDNQSVRKTQFAWFINTRTNRFFSSSLVTFQLSIRWQRRS